MSAEHSLRVDEARAKFEARWRPSDLFCVDGAFAERFERQLGRWNKAQVTGTVEEMDTHSSAMVRAYAAAFEKMKQYRDTAYFIAHDHDTGIAVCISAHADSVEAARRSTDQEIVWVTPEAVAKLVGQARLMSAFVEDKEDREA